MTRNETVFNMTQDWLKWARSKRLFCRPEARNILAMLQPSGSSGEPPDAELSPEIAAFHKALCALPADYKIPFLRVYVEMPKHVERRLPVKTMAYQLNIGRNTFYERAHHAAKRLHDSTIVILKAQEKILKVEDVFYD